MGVGDLEEVVTLRRVALVGLHRAPRSVGIGERELRGGIPPALELLHAELEHLARLLDLVEVGRIERAEVAIRVGAPGRRSTGVERGSDETLGLGPALCVA